MRNKIQLSLFLTLLILGVQGKFAYVHADPSVDFTYTGVCIGTPTIFSGTATGIPNVKSWKWDFGNGSYGSDATVAYTYIAPNTVPGGYPVVLTVTDDSGIEYTIKKYVLIQPLPVSVISSDSPNCSNNLIQFENLSTPTSGQNISKWTWNFDDGSPTESFISGDDLKLKHKFNEGTFDVTLTVTNSGNLCENTSTLSVTVVPIPVADFTFIGKCEDQVVEFKDAALANGGAAIVGWKWNFGDPTSGSGQNTSIHSDTTHVFAKAGTYTVKLIVTNYNTCTDTIEKQVDIHASPSLGFSYSSVCFNSPVEFNPDPLTTNLDSIAFWNWDFGDSETSNAENPIHNFTASNTFPVTLKITDLRGCTNEVTDNVIVHSLPVAQFSADISSCAGTKVKFLNQSTADASIGYIKQWHWDFGDGDSITIYYPNTPDILHLYALPNNYNVTLTVLATNGCSNNITLPITIKPQPVANFSFAKVCKGSSAEFTNLTQLNGSGSINNWAWNFGDAGSATDNFSTLQHPEHKFVDSGNLIVELIVTATNGCSGAISYPVLVNTPPPVNFTTSNNCQNSEVTFTSDETVMDISSVTSWIWDFGDGGSTINQQNPVYTFVTDKPYNVTLTIIDTNGCTNTLTKPVIIAPEPSVNFSFLQPACIQTPVQFNNLTLVPTGGYIVSSDWDFDDGETLSMSTLESVSHTYMSYGGFDVKLTITTDKGCIKTISLPMFISPQPIADFSFQLSCLNSAVLFSDLSQSGANPISERLWDFGDPGLGTGNHSTEKFPAHTFNKAGMFPVTLIVTNSVGCIDTIAKNVLVHELPTVDFTSAPGCVNKSTDFVSSTFVNAGAISSYYWTFGDGYTSTSVDPNHTYTNSGEFEVTLSVTDTAGCISSKTQSVTIAMPPSALFDISAQTCAGNPVSFSVLNSSSLTPVYSYYWDFGDGSDTLINAPAAGNVSHSYVTGSNFNVTLTVLSAMGCETKSQRLLIVTSTPVAQFSFENSCEGSTVNFTDHSSGGTSAPSVVNWSWSFDDPSSFASNTSKQQNPSHIFNSPGSYDVILQVGNASGCTNTVSKTIVINKKPTVDFDWTSSCIGTSTKFTINKLVAEVASIASYDWNFGDGTPHSTTSNPVHNYAVTDNFTVTLSIVNTSGCTNKVSHVVNILPQPSAFFSSNNSCFGNSIQFVDQSFTTSSAPINAWHWDFGVNSVLNDTSDQQNAMWNYKSVGVFDVKLTVTSQNGCQNTITLQSQVFANPTANFTYTASPCDNGTVHFEDSSFNKQSPIVGLKWEFEKGSYSTMKNPIHIFNSLDSCYTVRLIATDLRGCADTVNKQACVPAEFNFSFEASNTCISDSTYFTPKQAGTLKGTLVSYNWNFGDPNSNTLNTSTKKLPSHIYNQPGTYSISLKATDVYNCSSTVYQDITILPKPVSYFTFNEGVCDSSIIFNESSYSVGSTITKWIWSFGDGVKKTITSPDLPDLTHQYPANGMYTVGLTVTNAVGCSANVTVNEILVKPCLTAALELNDTLICQNNTLTFIDNSYTGNKTNEWYWDFGDGTSKKYSSYIERVTHVFTSAGTFKVKLIISTIIGGRKVSDTSKMNVLVNATPLPDFMIGAVCHEQTAVFTNMTSGNGTKISSYNWSFGEPLSDVQDTSSLKNPVHLYKAPGTYEVQLTVQNMIGCRDSILKPLTVYGLPDANYAYSVSCAGDNTAFTDLSVAAVAPIVNWDWTFYDDKGEAGKAEVRNPVFIYNAPGNYLVNLKVTDEYGCSDTINQYLTTWNVPTSIFSYTDNIEDIQGQLKFTNGSIDATKYYWNFGDGLESYTENPVVLYKNDGSYTISLVTWNDKNCTDTLNAHYEFMIKGLYVPNAFSPTNLKAEVQLLKPVGVNLVQYRFEVFDRWGNIIWWTDKLDTNGRPVEGWDGKYKGFLMPEGVYPWRASAVYKDGTVWEADNIGNTNNLPGSKVGTATMIH